jgi:hypothetical protein
MRFRTYASWLLPLGAFLNIWSAGETTADKHWSEFKTARQAHQEFEITRKVKTGYVDQVSRHQVTIDVSQDRWREQSTGGAGNLVRIFDGQNLFLTELEGTEYARLKTKAENEETLPGPYAAKLEWRKRKRYNACLAGSKKETTPASSGYRHSRESSLTLRWEGENRAARLLDPPGARLVKMIVLQSTS